LLRQFRQADLWVLVHLYRREQGLMIHPEALERVGDDKQQIFRQPLRWVERQQGAGSQRFLMEVLSRENLNVDDLDMRQIAYSEREAAALVSMREADIAPGAKAAAQENGLAFISYGWESFDIALPRNIWFRHLFQGLLQRLRSDVTQRMVLTYEGYDLSETGKLLWGED
jgi:molybdate-binding protein